MAERTVGSAPGIIRRRAARPFVGSRETIRPTAQAAHLLSWSPFTVANSTTGGRNAGSPISPRSARAASTGNVSESGSTSCAQSRSTPTSSGPHSSPESTMSSTSSVSTNSLQSRRSSMSRWAHSFSVTGSGSSSRPERSSSANARIKARPFFFLSARGSLDWRYVSNSCSVPGLRSTLFRPSSSQAPERSRSAIRSDSATKKRPSQGCRSMARRSMSRDSSNRSAARSAADRTTIGGAASGSTSRDCRANCSSVSSPFWRRSKSSRI